MKLGVIGCGKMGSALAGGIITSKLCEPSSVFAYDAYPSASEAFAKSFGATVVNSNAEVATKADVILLCVKPQGFTEMLADIADSPERLIISIAAGIQIKTIETATQERHRVVRVMPNTPSLVGKGAAGYALGSKATAEDATTTQALLDSVGYACQVEETQLDAVTAISGSGPAYIFLMIESLVAAGIEQGLSPEIAHQLAVQTVGGAAKLVEETGESPTTLRENVTSPNGTTFAALESFRESGFTSIVGKAAQAAADRSRELGRA